MLLWWYNNIVLNKGKVLEFFFFNSFYLEREEIHQKKEWPNKICMLFWIFVPKLSLFKRAGNSNKNLWFLTLSLILRTFVGCNNNIVFNFASYMNKFSSLNLVYIYILASPFYRLLFLFDEVMSFIKRSSILKACPEVFKIWQSCAIRQIFKIALIFLKKIYIYIYR